MTRSFVGRNTGDEIIVFVNSKVGLVRISGFAESMVSLCPKVLILVHNAANATANLRIEKKTFYRIK